MADLTSLRAKRSNLSQRSPRLLSQARDDGKTSIALLASWLVLFQLLIPLTFIGQDITLLCSETGVQQVSFDAEGNPVDIPNIHDHCDLCIVSTYDDDTLVTTKLSAPSFTKTAQSIANTQNSQLVSHYPTGFSSRAPPQFS